MDPKAHKIIWTYQSFMSPLESIPYTDYSRYFADRCYDDYVNTVRKMYKDYLNSRFGKSQKKEGIMPVECTFSFSDFLIRPKFPQIKRVIFSDPATVVIWNDNTKTVVKCENEDYDPEKGLAMCISKKALGNKGNYYQTFKKYLEQYERQKDLEDFHQDLN